jgi:hypothetical protein
MALPLTAGSASACGLNQLVKYYYYALSEICMANTIFLLYLYLHKINLGYHVLETGQESAVRLVKGIGDPFTPKNICLTSTTIVYTIAHRD